MPAYDKADIERRMDGAVEALKHDLGGLRTGRAIDRAARSGPGRGLRREDAAQPGRHRLGARAAHAHGAGLGPGQCRRRSRRRSATPASASTRSSTARLPPADPRPDRGAAQGAGQARPPVCRKGARSRSATSAATAWTRSRRTRRSRKSARTSASASDDEVQKLTDEAIKRDRRRARRTRKRKSCRK